MANALAKDLEIMFEEYVEGYEAACVISREAETSYPNATDMQRAGDTFYKKQNYHADVVTGLDVSAAAQTDVIERLVPTVYNSPDNVLYALDAKELRDPEHKKRMGQAASTRLAAEIDKNLYQRVVDRAAIVVDTTAALTWDDVATAEAQMITRGIGAGRNRKLFMNAFDWKDVGSTLGNKAYMGDVSKDAYERSQLPDIAGFRTFRTDNLVNSVVTGTVAGTTVNGAQSHTVTAMTGDTPTDNRQMVLNVAGANIANIKAGDSFTMVGVNATHQIDKTDTGQLQTFRVLSVAGGGANLTISPAIISSGSYQNCSAQAGAGAAITFLNTATKPANVFWADGAVSLDYGRLTFPQGEGVQVMTANTKNGVPLVMSYSFDQLTGKTTCRFTTLYATSVLDPEQCGLVIANQV